MQNDDEKRKKDFIIIAVGLLVTFLVYAATLYFRSAAFN